MAWSSLPPWIFSYYFVLAVLVVPIICQTPLAISASPTFYNPTIGTPVTLNCVVASGNATSITWLKDNSILNISGDSRFINGDVSTPSLSISNVQQTDSGSYVCRAADATGTVVNSSTITVSPQGTPPFVTIAQPSYSQFTGQQITLGCTVSSTNSPLQSVQWTFTNQGGSVTDPIVISTSSPLKYSGSTTSIPSLTVSSLASTDQGTYRCRASNLIGTTTSDQTVLSVTGSLLSVDVSPNSANVVQGTNQQITCTVAGTPEATGITWTRSSNNQLTTLDIVNSNGKYTGGTTSDPHLNIDNFQSSDAGTYVCRATNVVGSQNSDNSVLTYIQPLTLTISPPSGTATYGDASYTIQCQITGTTASLWSWTKTPINGGSTQQITQGSKYSIQNSPINPFLTINNIVEEDEADYACQATNLAGSASSSNSRFTVTGSTLTVGISPSSANVLQSTNQSVHCLISGQPSANNIQWLKTINSVQTSIDIVNSGGKYSGGTTGNPHITINNFQSSDTGIYVCRVTNAYGTETSPTSILTYIQSLSITISPLYGTAIVGDSSYQIQCQISGTTASSWSWTKTPVNGGSAQQITLGSNYSIQNSPTNPFLTINNIVEADEADYACQATNVAGSASSSNSRLIVNGGALSVSVTPATHSAVIGDNIVVIQCTVSGIPQATSWYWTCLPLASGSGSQTTIIQGTNNADYTVSNSNTNPHLTIKTITAADAGDYSCHATNVVGTSSSPQSRLAVTGDALSVSVTPATQGAVIGDNSVVIQCTVSGIPQALSWSWTSSPLGSGSGSQTTIAKGTNNGDYIVANSNTNPHLTIKTITTADAGDYICRATNAVGTSSSQKSRLTVTGEPDFYGGEIIALSWSIVIVIILLIALIVCSVLLGRRICRSAAECKDKDMGITSNRGKADVPRFDRVPTASTRPHNALHTPQHRVSRSDEYIDGRYETIPDRSYYVPHDAYYVPQDAYYVPHDAFYVPQADCI